MKKELERVVAFIEAHANEQLLFLVELCEENSFTHNKTGTDRVAARVLSQLGGVLPAATTVVQGAVGDHLILRNRPETPAIYLLGHMDTVFPPNHPFQHCRLDGDLLSGPGTADMKGGLAVIVYALKALEAAGLLDRLSLALILSGDEEVGSPSSRAMFLEEAANARACIVAECGGLDGEVVVSRNGKLGAVLRCTGRDSHVAFAGSTKSSAILELAYKIVALEALNGLIGGTAVNVGKVEGGLGPATVPKEASCLVDVRWRDEASRPGLLEKIDGVVATRCGDGCHSEWSVLNGRPAMPLQDGSRRLYAMVRKAAGRLGQDVGGQHRNGTSDANFFSSLGVPTVDGLGPIGDLDHTAEEHIRVASLKERTALLAALLIELEHDPEMASGVASARGAAGCRDRRQ